MCGIFGLTHFDRSRRVEVATLERMAATLRHRGPDDGDLRTWGNVGLGHQRLKIIDLSEAGRQPMSSADGRYWITLNGEIYNYLELRQRLIAGGRAFRSHTDTEVLLALYEDEGPDCLRHLNGMFAFVIWDSRERVLFGARDHFGIKPFYYTHGDGSFAFASEIKALLQTGLVRAELHPMALCDYLVFQFGMEDRTLFKNVYRLAPGHCLTVSQDGRLTVRAYWDLDFTVDTDHTEGYFLQRLGMLLEDSVRLQLRADVPVGAHLSGGLDSTAVTSLARALLDGAVHTFSGGFRESAAYDETPFARGAAGELGTIHHEVFPEPQDFVDTLPRLVYFMDEPAAGPGLFPQYFVSRLAAEHVKVVLGGQGGDEVFGGYARYLIAYLEACLKGGIAGTQEDPRYIVTFESILPNLTQLQGYEPLLRQYWQDGLFEEPDRRYYRLINRSNETKPFINGDVWSSAGYDPFESFRALFNHPDCHALINKMTRFDLKTSLPALLQVEDRTSMAASIESRVPLLDRRIVELVASMPPRIKYKGGRAKHAFREIVRDIVPRAVYARTDKTGFPVPLREWYRREPVRGFVRETLLGDAARTRGIVDTSQLARLLDSEQAYGRGIWGLLCLELWMKTFLDGRG